MALAGSRYGSLHGLSRPSARLAATISSSCSHCSIRCYSNLQDVTQEREKQPESSSGSARSSPSKKVETDYMKLFLQRNEDNIQPDLSALDELKPITRRPKFPREMNEESEEQRDQQLRESFAAEGQWKTTLERIKHSFTVSQLAAMCKEAKVPAELWKKYGAKRRGLSDKKKDSLARALMVHRFGMQDPLLVALADERKRLRNNMQVEEGISQIGVLLLALNSRSMVQAMLHAHNVRLRPVRKAGEGEEPERIVLIISGPEEGINYVQEWVRTFCRSIRTESFTTYKFMPSDSSIAIPDSHQLRLISDLSKAVVSIDEDHTKEVRIHSLNDASLSLAQSLLVQFFQDSHTTQRRQYYTYASPPVSAKQHYSVPTFAFEPHVGSSPLPWLSDPGVMSSLFRLNRQDVFDLQTNAFQPLNQEDPDKPILRHLNIPEDFETPKADASADEVFENLRKEIDVGTNIDGQWSFNVEFGTLLVNNYYQASPSKVLSLIRPPLPGSWPLEHALHWLRGESVDKTDVPVPTFVPCLPPIAVSMDAGKASASSVVPGTGETFNLNADERIERKREYWSEQLIQFGYKSPQTKNDLSEFVDLDSPIFSELVVLRYMGKKYDLIVELAKVVRPSKEGEEEPTTPRMEWKFQQAYRVQESSAGVLVPEAPVDLLFGARYTNTVPEDILMKSKCVQEYLKGLNGDAAERMKEGERKEKVAEPNPLPPSDVRIGLEHFHMSSARRTSRWMWDIKGKKAAQYQGKIVMDRAALDNDAGYSSALRMEFGERNVEKILQEEEVPNEKDNETTATIEQATTTPQWQDIRPWADLFLSRQYRSLSSR